MARVSLIWLTLRVYISHTLPLTTPRRNIDFFANTCHYHFYLLLLRLNTFKIRQL